MDMFLRIGKLKGEAQDDKHKDKIDIKAWSWTFSNPTTVSTGGGSGSGKVSVGNLVVKKYIDVATPALILACCQGTHNEDAELIVRESGGDAPVEYLKITMKQVFVSSVKPSGADHMGRLSEELILNFREFTLAYTEQDDTGKPKTPVLTVNYDIAKNKVG